MTERLHFHFSLSCIGEGNGNPLQCSCLENPRDRGASWAAVYGVTQSRTWLKRLSSRIENWNFSIDWKCSHSFLMERVMAGRGRLRQVRRISSNVRFTTKGQKECCSCPMGDELPNLRTISLGEETPLLFPTLYPCYLALQASSQHEIINLVYLFLSPAAAAAKLLQSCPTLCDPIDGSPPGFPVPGILHARTLEWVAISFSNAWKWKVKVNSLSRVWPYQPHGLEPTSLLHPWDFPGKSTGVGCHCLLHFLAQSPLTIPLHCFFGAETLKFRSNVPLS